MDSNTRAEIRTRTWCLSESKDSRGVDYGVAREVEATDVRGDGQPGNAGKLKNNYRSTWWQRTN